MDKITRVSIIGAGAMGEHGEAEVKRLVGLVPPGSEDLTTALF